MSRPYRLMVAVSETAPVEDWVRLALRLIPEVGEICLRGMITIEADRSLSEGALRAQQLRDRFDDLIAIYPMIRSENWVRVDYDPFERLLTELVDFPVDLLLAEWEGPRATTGGISTDTILKHAPCDICLISGDVWKVGGPVLFAMHGGPNMSLGLSVARALSSGSQISLFHATDTPQEVAELYALLGTEGGIGRIVIVRGESDLRENIVREAADHHVVVMGASFYESHRKATFSGDLVNRISERLDKPLVLVRAWDHEDIKFHLPRFIPRREEDISTRVDRWFAENSFDADEFDDLDMLVSLKERQGVTISIGLPALNEEETVGNVITTIKSALMDEVPLVDEIVLIDSNSTDNTVQIAQDIGIPVYRHPDILPEVGSVRGKGEALWKSLYVLKGDIIAWVDTDIKNIHPRFVYGILGPLLRNSRIQYVKGFYRRPILVGEQLQAYGGGRVTELVARPLFNLFYPEISGVVQPLSGEYAGRRSALERVPFFSGYGVETGLLIDLFDLFGLDGIAQTNLKERVHHNQPLVGLSKMSFSILQVFIQRLESRYGVKLLDMASHSMKLITQTPERFALDVNEIGDLERPPMMTVPMYQQREITI